MSIFRNLEWPLQDSKIQKKSPSLSTCDIAKNLLKAAVLADSQGNLSEGLRLYKQSLDKWFEVLSTENDPVEKDKIKDLISLYMTRAEEIKAILSQPTAEPATTGTKRTIPTKATSPRPSDTTNYHKKTARMPPLPRRTVSAGPSTPGTAQTSKSDEYENQIASEWRDTSPGVRLVIHIYIYTYIYIN